MSMDLEEQYDKIYRYCYFKVHQRETAEDITQETFLRFLDSSDDYGQFAGFTAKNQPAFVPELL